MKMKLGNFLKIAFILCGITLLASSCTEDKYYTDPSIETQWEITEFTINKGDWKWDENDASYYYDFDYKELTPFIAEKGAVLASTLIDGTYRPLAYTTYFINEKGQYCAETINYEYGAGFVRFNISTLDLFENTKINFQPNTFKFKVTLIW
jgi:hypothetical protein